MYRKIIILLLIVGILTAAPFPQTISGSTMQLTDYTGDTASGEAYYESPDGMILGHVATTAMSYSEFVSYPYESDGWTETNEVGTGALCYYICDTDSDSYGPFAYCWTDCHKNDIYYLVDSAMYGGTKYDALYEGIALAKAIINSATLPPPDDGNGGEDGGSDNGGNGGIGGNESNGEESEEGGTTGGIGCPCAPAFVLIALAGLAIRG